MNRIRIRTQKKLLLMNIPLTVKAPKIKLIQAKVMKMTKTDIYAISRFITNFKAETFRIKISVLHISA